LTSKLGSTVKYLKFLVNFIFVNDEDCLIFAVYAF
jgi:hypothetical protein